jgi:hypothetical protein
LRNSLSRDNPNFLADYKTIRNSEFPLFSYRNLRYEKRGKLFYQGMEEKKYIIQQWKGVSLIENPNQKSERNSSMGIYSVSKKKGGT